MEGYTRKYQQHRRPLLHSGHGIRYHLDVIQLLRLEWVFQARVRLRLGHLVGSLVSAEAFHNVGTQRDLRLLRH